MVTTEPRQQLQIYCRAERAVIPCDRCSTIVCPKGYEVAREFPDEEAWTYCCDCQKFTPLDAIEDGAGYSQCFQCDRTLSRRFLCCECNLLTVATERSSTSGSFRITP